MGYLEVRNGWNIFSISSSHVPTEMSRRTSSNPTPSRGPPDENSEAMTVRIAAPEHDGYSYATAFERDPDLEVVLA